MTSRSRRLSGVLSITRFRLRYLAGESLWLIPAIYVALAFVMVVVVEVLPEVDLLSAPQVDATLLTSVASGMLALAGFVITISFITVEFASIAMSPRLVGILRRDRMVKRALGLAFGAFTFSTIGALLVKPEENPADDLFGIIATIWSILAAVMFVVMLDRITNTLRAGNAVATVGDKARTELEVVHPVAFGDEADAPLAGAAPDAPLEAPGDATIEVHDGPEAEYWDGDRGMPPTRRFLGDGDETLHHEGRPGVLVAADLVALSRLAAELDTRIDLHAPVGRFLPAGAAVLRVHGARALDHERTLRSALAWASEPTLASDPRHAFRVLVDIGLKGLAPGVNDPTTAVQAIDQMHDLLRRLAWRQLGELRVRDAEGAVRVTMPSPSWGHYLRLSCEELADFGARHAQVRRHLRVMLDDLCEWAPEERHATTRMQREKTEQAMERLRAS
ncbi:DUF2254 domain-containing protein [Patulibacter minatonensis]|uniref:DUF2254 domain-containing protein n=1 Tax=Patulibacter minatonensis TaxID=298163 RepID=UPI00047B61AF|nr:DUF2254 domain-containing protein [Patulibacter minatonensis]